MSKLPLTPQRLAANRKNAALGAAAVKTIYAEKYNANPSFCQHCGTQLPQKKKTNKYCSQSCAAKANNTGKVKVPRKACAHCGNPTLNKFCSTKCSGDSRRKYSAEESIKVRKKRQREISAKYRAALRNQTPPDANHAAIREFYDRCPKGHEVDHIIPISKGGLHTLDNLQYLTISENRKKSNKI